MVKTHKKGNNIIVRNLDDHKNLIHSNKNFVVPTLKLRISANIYIMEIKLI